MFEVLHRALIQKVGGPPDNERAIASLEGEAIFDDLCHQIPKLAPAGGDFGFDTFAHFGEGFVVEAFGEEIARLFQNVGRDADGQFHDAVFNHAVFGDDDGKRAVGL